MRRNTTMGAGLVVAALLVGGCRNTQDGMERDAELAAERADQAAERSAEAAREAGRDLGQAADQATDATREAARETAEATREAGQTVREGAASVARTGDAAQQTAQIKSALMADTTIDAVNIDVDTEASTRTITLTGRVRTAAEKTRAARIAVDKAPGYRVTNNLQVGR